jgi:hypothetical protein
MATKKPTCTDFPHPYAPDKGGCPLDRLQYLRESRRRQTTSEQREGMRQAAHQGLNMEQAEDDADEGA